MLKRITKYPNPPQQPFILCQIPSSAIQASTKLRHVLGQTTLRIPVKRRGTHQKCGEQRGRSAAVQVSREDRGGGEATTGGVTPRALPLASSTLHVCHEGLGEEMKCTYFASLHRVDETNAKLIFEICS